MSIVKTLIFVQRCLTRYLLSTILIMGTFGNLLAIGIFSQKKHRTNSCSIYLIAVSVFGIVAANWGIAPLVYALDHFDMVNSSIILCRIRGYIIQVNSMCYRYTLILMCADRYASCSSRVSIRALCRPKVAYRSIGIMILFWMTVSIHLLILESIENGRCFLYGLYAQIYAFYSLIFTGIIPIASMTVISILLIKNLRQVRSRVRPLNDSRELNRRDIKLIKLVLVEVVVYILCTFAYPIVLIYTTLTDSMIPNRSVEYRQIEAFMIFITLSLLLYMSYITTFYIHFIGSREYRAEVKQLILKLIRKSSKSEQPRNNVLQMMNQTRIVHQIEITGAV